MVQTLLPLLPAATLIGDKALQGLGDESGKSLLHWLVAHFKGKDGAVVLERAIAEPSSPFRQKALENEIAEQATLDPPFREELARILKAAGSSQTYKQTAIQEGGSGNTIQQIQGIRNTMDR